MTTETRERVLTHTGCPAKRDIHAIEFRETDEHFRTSVYDVVEWRCTGCGVTVLVADRREAERPAAAFMSELCGELCDLITLMPDAQVDEILEYVRVLREARALGRR